MKVAIYPILDDHSTKIVKEEDLTFDRGEASIPLLASICYRLTRDKIDYKSTLDYITSEIVRIVGVEYGCIATSKDGSTSYLKCIAKEFVKGDVHLGSSMALPVTPKDMGAFTHIKKGVECLFGAAIKKKVIIISNDPKTDPRSSKTVALPKTHPTITNFLSIPLFSSSKRVIGQLALANKSGDFTPGDAARIYPMVEIIARLLYKSTKSKTKERLATEELDKQRAKEDAKDKFLATMSHELRTPLNGIVGMITMLRDAGELNEKQKEYVSILMECSHQLMNLMNNILDFSKMTSNRLVLLRNPLDITKCVNDAVAMIDNKAKGKGLKIINDIQDDLPMMVGDHQRLTQVISNLLSNSIKFTDKGHIKIRVRTLGTSTQSVSRKWKIIFDIEDTGIGIPQEDQEHLFSVFHQTQGALKLGIQGSGLGLSIVKELVRLMEGKIAVHSEGIPGRGSTFSFYIVCDEQLEVSDTHRDMLRGVNILIVDDRQEYRLQLVDMLYKWECIPIIASSGEEALLLLSHNPNIKCVIVDICMKYMSGLELAQEIRKSYGALPLIALSSVSLDTKTGSEMFDYYMNKPIDHCILLPAVIGCITKDLNAVSKKRRNSNRPKKHKKDLRILIAEDENTNAYTITEMLKYLGYVHIERVENGEKCVEKVRKTKRGYDVILLDIIMPVMDGLEAAKHIRQLQHRPYMVVVSAAVQNSDKERWQNIGIDGYLPKPVMRDSLETVLRPLVLEE